MSVAPLLDKDDMDEVDTKDTELTEEEKQRKFNEEASKIEVPTSIAMNQLRDDINKSISRSSLHVECVLEVMRSACVALEEAAAKTASEEYASYQKSINDLRKKYDV